MTSAQAEAQSQLVFLQETTGDAWFQTGNKLRVLPGSVCAPPCNRNPAPLGTFWLWKVRPDRPDLLFKSSESDSAASRCGDIKPQCVHLTVRHEAP